MALKRCLSEDEKFGLTQEEVRIAEKYLRRNKTAGAISEVESMKLYELYMIGCGFVEMNLQYPQYPVAQIALTAALRGWPKDREKMSGSLRGRVQAKVVRSVMDSVDFMTTMLAVSNAEHLSVMRQYILDPANNPKPDLRIESIKEYKEMLDALQKLVAGAQGGAKASPMYNTLSSGPHVQLPKEEEFDPSKAIADGVIDI